MQWSNQVTQSWKLYCNVLWYRLYFLQTVQIIEYIALHSYARSTVWSFTGAVCLAQCMMQCIYFTALILWNCMAFNIVHCCGLHCSLQCRCIAWCVCFVCCTFCPPVHWIVTIWRLGVGKTSLRESQRNEDSSRSIDFFLLLLHHLLQPPSWIYKRWR